MAAALGTSVWMQGTTSADAAVYKFYSSDEISYAGRPFAGSAMFSAINPAAVDVLTGGSGCGPTGTTGNQDVCGPDNGSLIFNDGAGGSFDFTVSASGGTNPYVREDLHPNYGGLGVESDSNTDDQIDGSETIRFNFSDVVTISGILTLFDTRGHAPFDPLANANVTELNLGPLNIEYRLGGVGAFATLTFAQINAGNLGLTSNIFEFRQASDGAEYYISGLQVVPLPGAALLFGSALLGLAGWRRYRGGPAAA